MHVGCGWTRCRRLRTNTCEWKNPVIQTHSPFSLKCGMIQCPIQYYADTQTTNIQYATSHLCIVMFLHVIHLYDMIILLSYMQMVMSAVLQRGTVIFKKTESPNPEPQPVKPASGSPGKSMPKLGVIGRRGTLSKSPTKYVKPEQASSLAELKKRLEVMLFLSWECLCLCTLASKQAQLRWHHSNIVAQTSYTTPSGYSLLNHVLTW